MIGECPCVAFLRERVGQVFGLPRGGHRGQRQPAVAVDARTRQYPPWRAHSLHVIEPGDREIASLTVYVGLLGPKLFPAFGLPPA
jgi:hypothetical protein